MTAATTAGTAPEHHAGLRRRRRHHSFGFWVAMLAFLVNMGFSAVPTPLYVLYQHRDHFSTIMITVVYAVYAVGVIVSLFLGGHVSDWIGRKRVLVPALLIDVVSATIFLTEPSLPGLLVARVVNGISVGLTTATATAYLAELHQGTVKGAPAGPTRKAQVVATAANLGGIGVGPLVAGLLAQYAPQPLHLSYVVFGAALLLLAVLVAVAPETATRPDPAPPYRPQRMAVPAHARRMFFAATAAGLAAFAVFGVFNSLAPSFLAGTLHQSSHAVAGAVPFSAFAAGAVAQIAFSRAGLHLMLRVAPLLLVPGLALLAAGMWLPNLTVFVVGGVLSGAGGGLAFRGALGAAGATAPPESRAEVLAGYFLGAYIGLSVPVVGLGVATQYVAARTVMLVFVVIVAVALVLSTRMVRGAAASGSFVVTGSPSGTERAADTEQAGEADPASRTPGR
ncbi:MFS transporter [Actinacidiphila acididurans]|uniref:MFS transporter n=1 Tax=Actinacidiphila acididurans TaxID=2784346 RepID=A0ABS2TPI7_9ACTN|nr:MFS transporter [Actinacidiphila acididurans]MBM9505259.1 MFS transporter [Actinacidiphila acididurans]